MKLHRAAALALAGWYLMLLPQDQPSFMREPAPWSTIQRSFDTAKECEDSRAKAVLPPAASKIGRAAARLAGKATPLPTGTVEHDLAFYCVASDDPRLR